MKQTVKQTIVILNLKRITNKTKKKSIPILNKKDHKKFATQKKERNFQQFVCTFYLNIIMEQFRLIALLFPGML